LDTYVIGDSFGFEDGISQPLMNGIDELDANAAVNMNTDPRLLIVTADTWSEEDTVERPTWMYDGSFLVFRKLEQNVKGFEALVAQWQMKNCESKAHMGAKLIGRWQSGKCHIVASILRAVGILLLADDSHNRCSTRHARLSHRGLEGSGHCETDQQLHFHG
jgi:deferrochelatase/peroxidase EfeB